MPIGYDVAELMAEIRALKEENASLKDGRRRHAAESLSFELRARLRELGAKSVGLLFKNRDTSDVARAMIDISEWWRLVPDTLEPCSTTLFEERYATAFEGPGWYALGTTCFLVVPVRATSDTVWRQKYQGDLLVYSWFRPNGVPPWETFNALYDAPVRRDSSEAERGQS